MIAVRVEGLDELAKTLNGMPDRVSRKHKVEALMEGGELIHRLASQTAPREPGTPDLAANLVISAKRRGVDDDPREVSVGIGVPVRFFYDYFLEYGTNRMGARPFWRPAFDGQAPRAIKVIGDAFWTALAAKGVSRSVSAPSSVQSLGSML